MTGTAAGRRATSPHVHRSRLIAALLAGAVLSLAVACGDDSVDTSQMSQLARDGRQLYMNRGCAGCHGGDGSGGIGPAVAGLHQTERELTDGSTVVADEAYIRRSITDPDAEIVTGYSIRMPANQLADADVDALVAYLLELESTP